MAKVAEAKCLMRYDRHKTINRTLRATALTFSMTLMSRVGWRHHKPPDAWRSSQALTGTTSVVNLVHEPPQRSAAKPAVPIHLVEIPRVLLAGTVSVEVEPLLPPDRTLVPEVPRHVLVDEPRSARVATSRAPLFIFTEIRVRAATNVFRTRTRTR